jgi:hypothetical protein
MEKLHAIKQKAIAEARRAVELLPVGKDALDATDLMTNLALVYAWTGEKDLAFEQLNAVMHMPGQLGYGSTAPPSLLEPDPRRPSFRKTARCSCAKVIRRCRRPGIFLLPRAIVFAHPPSDIERRWRSRFCQGRQTGFRKSRYFVENCCPLFLNRTLNVVSEP